LAQTSTSQTSARFAGESGGVGVGDSSGADDLLALEERSLHRRRSTLPPIAGFADPQQSAFHRRPSGSLSRNPILIRVIDNIAITVTLKKGAFFS